MDRFDVDYQDEERGIQHFQCEDGEYVLADDAIKEIEQLENERFSKKEIRAVLIEAYKYACEPDSEVDILIQQMVKNKTGV